MPDAGELRRPDRTELEAAAQAVDWGMHDTFIDALGNTIISNAYRVNSIKMRLIHQERFRIDGRVGPVMGEHLTVLDAIETAIRGRRVDG